MKTPSLFEPGFFYVPVRWCKKKSEPVINRFALPQGGLCFNYCTTNFRVAVLLVLSISDTK